MALPTCPSCGQSVLDDDVEECPFCNASMKSSSKPVLQKPKVVTSPSEKKPAPPAKEPVKKPSVSKPSTQESTPQGKPAPRKKTSAPSSPPVSSTDGLGIPLVKFRSKTNRFAVVCPMCDTIGYAPKSASGREVRCVNSECLVPLFEAPRLKSEKKEEVAAPRSLMPIISGGVVLLAIAGVAVCFFVFKPKRIKPNPGIDNPPVAVVDIKPKENDDKKNNPETKPPKKNDPPPIIYPSFAEIQKEALTKMIPAAQDVTGNRSKPYCRWQTAETYIDVGKLEFARAEIKQLGRVKPSIPFYQIMPLSQLAWKELENNQDATATVKQAYALSTQFPRPGEEAFEAKVKLAALLVGVNRDIDALSLIEKEREDQAVGRFVKLLLQTEAEQTGDFDAVVKKSPILPLHQPQWSAVAMIIASHGKFDDAVRWSKQHPDSFVQAESLASCFELKAYLELKQSNSDAHDKIITELLSHSNHFNQFGKETKAYLMARIAIQQYYAGHQAGAAKTLKDVKQHLSQMKIPAPITRPSMKMIYHGKFSMNKQLKILAFAFAEVARLEAILSHPKESWQQLEQGLACMRGISPSPVVSRKIISELNQSGRSYFESELKNLLELKNNDQAAIAFKDYRKHARQLVTVSEARFQLQTLILSHATTWEGLPLQIWKEAKERMTSDDTEQKEPYQETALTDYLIPQFDSVKEKTIIDEINLIQKNPSKTINLPMLVNNLKSIIQKGEFKRAAALIESTNGVDRYSKKRLSLQLVCQLINKSKLKEAVQLTRTFNDPLVREPAFRLISTLATHNGKGQPFWEECKGLKLPPTEKISLYRGMVAGITAGKLTEVKTSSKTEKTEK